MFPIPLSIALLAVSPVESACAESAPDAAASLLPLSHLSADPCSGLTPLDPERGEMSYRVMGEDHPETLVLVHGLDSAWQTFTPILEPLARHYRLVVYDQRGHGGSAAIGEDYSNTLLACDLRALLDHLGVQETNLLGHSLGGRTAMRFAQLFPDRVKRLVVEDIDMHLRLPLTSRQRAYRRRKARLLAAAFADATFPTREALAAALAPLYGKEAMSLTYRRARQTDQGFQLLFHPEVTVLYGSQSNAEDLLPALAGLRAPVLFIRADPARGAALSDLGVAAIRGTLPAAEIRTIEGAGHNVHGTRTEEYLRILEEFLGR